MVDSGWGRAYSSQSKRIRWQLIPPAADPPVRACDIRPAALADLDSLVALENACFDIDRLTRRQFRYMLTKAQAATLVAQGEDGLLGYVMLLFSRGTSVARLYSIAVAQQARGQGVGRALVEAAELTARDSDRFYVRLEIRRDNLASQRLFDSCGYRRFGVLSGYYEDHMEALRYERSLAPHLRPELVRVPFYEQTLDFTCGSSSLMMAMKALDPQLTLDNDLARAIAVDDAGWASPTGHDACDVPGCESTAVMLGLPRSRLIPPGGGG